MPIYEYVCTSCGKETEAIQRFSDAPLTRCTCAEQGELVRKLSLTAFHLKGSGWYNHGYAKSAEGKGGSEGSAEKAAAPQAAAGGCGAEACAGGCMAAGAAT
ncbi:MAG: zinc ribbon domain-containing protein [Candidatus Lambdaproteobacteria bacterium]|nr:zinc ribbon domain-containing protein [Candidatus Lambdaproteobacteria bacterium]